jgi:solute carrier family 25 (mitochondrial S-adenosylmethionine transporter), member 26
MIRQESTSGKGDRSGGSTSMQALRRVGGHGAWKRLFTGYTALAARNLPTTAIQFPLFEHLRARMWSSRGGEPSDPKDKDLLRVGFVSGVSAGSAGAFAAWVTTPSDVVKTRMMLSAGQDGNDKGKRQGAWAVAGRVYEERGIRGFFRGALFRSIWTALGLGLYLGTYDMAKVWLRRRKPDSGERIGM